MVRKRLGLLAILALFVNQAVSAWDWWSRTKGLDPYFGAQGNTFWGHFLAAALSPWWLLVVAVFFGLAWCFEPRFHKEPKADEPGGRAESVVASEPDWQSQAYLLKSAQRDLAKERERVEFISIALEDEKQKRETAEKALAAAQEIANEPHGPRIDAHGTVETADEVIARISRERDEATTQRDVLQVEVEQWKASANPTKLREAARFLARDIREYVVEVEAAFKAGVDSPESDIYTSQTFIDRFMPRYKKIKDRMQAEIPRGKFEVNSWAHWWPNKLENIELIADDLDHDARRVAEDALL